MIKNICNEILEWINNNRKKFIGSILGFILGILMLSIGFFKTIFLLICTVIGYFIGSKSFNLRTLKDLLERILPPGKIR